MQLRSFSAFVYSFLMAGFIHPLLARFFWVTGPRQPLFGSPYRYCNGTFIYNRDHSFFLDDSQSLNDFVFIDFAGSGIVHLCGESMILLFSFPYLLYQLYSLPQ